MGRSSPTARVRVLKKFGSRGACGPARANRWTTLRCAAGWAGLRMSSLGSELGTGHQVIRSYSLALAWGLGNECTRIWDPIRNEEMS